MQTLNPQAACFIVVKARAFDAKAAPDDPDSGSNPSDDRMIDVLGDTRDDATLEELSGAIRALNEDESEELVALVFLGRGDFTKAEWQAARDHARRIPPGDRMRYLVGTPLLADYLEEGLAAWGHSCAEFEKGRM